MVYTLDDIRNKIIPVAKKYNLSAVYLFGSYARGEADEESDLDLVFDGFDYDEYDYYDLYQDMENALNMDFDMLSLETILSPKTYVGQLVKQNFMTERKSLYENV